MSYTLAAQSRTALGRQAKQVMATGNIPAIMYGHGIESKAIQVNASDFRKLLRNAGTSSLVDVTLDGAAPVKVLLKEVQVHPITMAPVHVDFQQIRMNEELTTEVPLKFVGESKAVKELAGTLVHSFDALTVTCLPADLPHEIVVDLSMLTTFDKAITIASLNLPKGVKIEENPDVTVATVVAPLTDEQLKKLEEMSAADVSTIKTEAEIKKAEGEVDKPDESAAKKVAG